MRPQWTPCPHPLSRQSPYRTSNQRHPAPLLPERSDFLEGDAPAAARVEAFLAHALEATGSDADITAAALVPWICDAPAIEPLGQSLRP